MILLLLLRRKIAQLVFLLAAEFTRLPWNWRRSLLIDRLQIMRQGGREDA